MLTVKHNYNNMSTQLRLKGRKLIKGVDSDVFRTAIEISRTARDKAPKARSELTQSIQVHKLGPANYHIRAEKEYASAVENGTYPGGQPSLRAIKDWIKVKGITPISPDIRKRDLPFLIRRSIAKNGTPPRPFMRPAANQHVPALMQTITRHMGTEWGTA